MPDTAYEGASWDSHTVTYAYGDATTSTFISGDTHFTNSISDAYKPLVEMAMHAWEKVANVTFQQVFDTNAADMDIGWRSYQSASQLGETQYSYYSDTTAMGGGVFLKGMFVDFEDPSVHYVGTDATSYYSGTSATLYEIILHELGHALGLAHSSNGNALMYPYLSPANNGISQYDIIGAQTIYGAPLPPMPNTPTLANAFNGHNDSAAPLLIDNDSPLLTGTAVVGDEVDVLEIDAAHGTIPATQTMVGTTTADANGNWTLQLHGVGNGSHSYAATDVSAAGSVSLASNVVTFTVDADTPVAPTLMGSSLTNVARPTLSGTAEAGTRVVATEGGMFLGNAIADNSGIWSILSPMLADGVHSIVTTATDLVGHVSAPSTPFSLTVDTTAPVAPGAPVAENPTGLVVGMSVTLYGSGAEALSLVTLLDGAIRFATVMADTSGRWNASLLLSAGDHSLTATDTDAAGNVSRRSAGLTLTVSRPPAPPTQTTNDHISPTPDGTPTPVMPTQPVAHPVYRFFDQRHGTQFLTSSEAERDGIIAARPDLSYEGKAMGSVDADPSNPNVASVFRFFDTSNGTHFFTTSADERNGIVAHRHDLVLENTNLFEHSTQQAGDVAVYRFFNTGDGSHFFTSNATESASIVQTRPDMVAEGVSFYVPNG